MSIESVRKWYPKALTSIDTVNRLLDTIEEHLGLKPYQLMHADSMCCDDVNAIQYPPRANEMLGPFHLGGLDGFPLLALLEWELLLIMFGRWCSCDFLCPTY